MLSTPFTVPHSGLEIYSAIPPITCPSAFSDPATPAHERQSAIYLQHRKKCSILACMFSQQHL